MIVELESNLGEVADLCRRFSVRRLAVFGSASVGSFDRSSSDVDFLVEFQPAEALTRFDAYFGLKESLEDLLGYPVDLVDPSALRNPYFARTVEQSRRDLYAA